MQEVAQEPNMTVSDLSCQRKNPKGRPRKKNKQMCDFLVSSSPSTQSCKEAQNKWDTAKILGISALDEKSVLSGLRISKRLLILDGKPE